MGNNDSKYISNSKPISESKLKYLILVGIANGGVYDIVKHYCDDITHEGSTLVGKMRHLNTTMYANVKNSKDLINLLEKYSDENIAIMMCAELDDRFVSEEMKQYTAMINRISSEYSRCSYHTVLIADKHYDSTSVNNAVGS